MIEMLQEWVHSHRLCKMAIPKTSYMWITMLLGFEKEKETLFLIVDKAKGVEKVLAHHMPNGLRFEFLEKDGILCWFENRLVQSRPSTLLTQMPEAIFRLQRRRFVRVNARSGTEIFFQKNNGSVVTATVKDYGLGGVAFMTPPTTHFHIEELVCEVNLKIPYENGWKHFNIPLSKVKRLEKSEGGGGVCVLEFIEIPEAEKEQLWHCIFQEQRLQLRKTGKM